MSLRPIHTTLLQVPCFLRSKLAEIVLGLQLKKIMMDEKCACPQRINTYAVVGKNRTQRSTNVVIFWAENPKPTIQYYRS